MSSTVKLKEAAFFSLLTTFSPRNADNLQVRLDQIMFNPDKHVTVSGRTGFESNVNNVTI